MAQSNFFKDNQNLIIGGVVFIFTDIPKYLSLYLKV